MRSAPASVATSSCPSRPDPFAADNRRCLPESLNVDPRRAQPHHALPLRPADPPRPAGRPAAAGAALANPHPELLDEGRAGRALHQLAAGPAGELPRAARLPEADDVLSRRGRPGRRDGGLQPVRFLPRAERGKVSLRLRARAAGRARALPAQGAGDAAVQDLPRSRRPQREADEHLPDGAQPGAAEGHRLPDPHGARRADARADAAERERLVPRQRVAAGAAPASSRPGGALRLGLPDPAEERRQVARRPERHRGRLHRPARLVRGLSARRRLDRPRPDVRPLRRRRPHPARVLARAVVGGADQRHARPVRDDLRAPHVGAARLGSAARHLAVQRAAVGRDRRARQGRSTPTCAAWTSA